MKEKERGSKSNTRIDEKKGDEDRERKMNNAWGRRGKYLEGRAGRQPDLRDVGCHAEKHGDIRGEGRERWSAGDPRDPDS